MANSVSGQDEPNPALWLATRAGRMELSCPLGITCCVPEEKFLRSGGRFTKVFCRDFNFVPWKIFSVTVKDFLWSLYQLAWEQAQLWVTRASGEEQSDPAGRSLVKRRFRACAPTWACSQAMYQWIWKTRKLKPSTRMKTKKTKMLTSFMNLGLFCNKKANTKVETESDMKAWKQFCFTRKRA